MKNVIWYKVINADNCGIYSGFDFTKYLPKCKNCKGKWLPDVDKLTMCNSGYHITRFWNMWFRDKCRVFIVEPRGLVNDNTPGVVDKHLCRSFRFIREIFPDFDGRNNTGDWNTGDGNTGYWNTGDRNTGYWNTGNRNTGNWNTGDRNTGHWNTGHWNTSDKHTGCFNTEKPKIVYLFNKPIKFEEFEKISFPRWFYFDILKDDDDLHKSWLNSFNNASVQDVRDAISLPNFDYNVFECVTGISKKMINNKIMEKRN